MATYTAGCSAVGGFSYAGNFTLYVVLTDSSGSSSTNQSTVTYNVYCRSSGSGSINAKHTLYFALNGSTIKNSTDSVNVSSPNANIPIASGTMAVTHNSDGTKSIPFSASIKGVSYGVASSVSGTFTLNTIPRYATIKTFTVSNQSGVDGLTKVKFAYTTDSTIDYAWYSKDNGSTWSNLPTTRIISGLTPRNNL